MSRRRVVKQVNGFTVQWIEVKESFTRESLLIYHNSSCTNQSITWQQYSTYSFCSGHRQNRKFRIPIHAIPHSCHNKCWSCLLCQETISYHHVSFNQEFKCQHICTCSTAEELFDSGMKISEQVRHEWHEKLLFATFTFGKSSNKQLTPKVKVKNLN